MKRIRVKTKPKGYEVSIANGALSRAGAMLRSLTPSKEARCFIVSAEPVRQHWGSALGESLAAEKILHEWLMVPDGERAKTMATVEELASRMAEFGADRGSVVIAFGGGVVGDMAGLLASLYMRGVALVQVPTTLLAQVDASIGGKTGVNLKAGKNLIGTFHQPLGVITDPAVLATLPEREFRAGLFEALKCGVIRDAKLFAYMERHRDALLGREEKALAHVIERCVQVKAAVVATDVKEKGRRRILNFGHTVGHALESLTNYRRYLHGEAVGWGMVAAAMIGAGMGKTPSDAAKRIIAAVLAYSPLPPVEVRPEDVLARLRSDKKTRAGMPHFVVPRGIGRVEVVAGVPDEAILEAVERVKYLSLR